MVDTLKALLASLPAAASSPLALAAYVAALAVWGIISWRVSRNRQLLEHLASLPERDRLTALELEMGQVRVRSGLTPEQWLRSRITQYLFWGFVISIAFVVGAILWSASRRPRQPEVALTLASDDTAKSLDTIMLHDGADSLTQLQYTYQSARHFMTITPAFEYLTALGTDASLPSLGGWEPFQWTFPALTYKVTNNTDRTVFLADLVVRVEASEIDRTPVPYVYSPKKRNLFYLLNDGWGRVVDPVLDLGFRLGACDGAPPSATDITLRKATFSTGIEVDTTDLLPAAVAAHQLECSNTIEAACIESTCTTTGTSRLRCVDAHPGIECTNLTGAFPASEKSALLALHRASGGRRSVSHLRFLRDCAALPICVGLRLKYHDESGRAHDSRFWTEVFLAREGPHALRVASPDYHYNLFLKAGKTGYQTHLPLSQAIKPGDVDQFVVVVAANKSGTFRLVSRLVDTAGDTVDETVIALKALVSRSSFEFVDRTRSPYHDPLDAGSPQSPSIPALY